MHRTTPPTRTTLASSAGALPPGGALGAVAPTTAAAHASAADSPQARPAGGVGASGVPKTPAVLPDGPVPHTARDGPARPTDPAGTGTPAGRAPARGHDEDRPQGIGTGTEFAARSG